MLRASKFEDWAPTVSIGTISNIFKNIATGDAEVVRYLEFLANENKFTNATQLDSITRQTDLIGYKQSLPTSAFGYVIISHKDDEQQSRLPNLGTIFFDIDQTSNYDDLVKNSSATYVEKNALTPWTADSCPSIPEGTIFNINGIPFISTETVQYRALKEPYSTIKSDEDKYDAFIEAGGWNGIKYLKVPVLQGEQKSVDLGYAEGGRFEAFTYDGLDIEEGATKVSNKYFNITVTPLLTDGTKGTPQTWERVDDVLLADSNDKVFDVRVLDSKEQVMIRFGDGIRGQTLPSGALVTLNYISTLGESGNVETRFNTVTMTLPDGYELKDPRNDSEGFLDCINYTAIMGGKDIEDASDIKLNAPTSYLRYSGLASDESYIEQIKVYAPQNLLCFKVFSSDELSGESYESDDSEKYVSSYDENSVLSEIKAARKSLIISAIKANGTLFDDPETELIEPLEEALSDKMSSFDSLAYIEPNIVKIRYNAKIKTTDNVVESDLSEEIKDTLGKYTVFGKEFEEDWHTSNVDDTVHEDSHVSYIDSFVEAEADVDMKPEIISQVDGSEWLEDEYLGLNDTMKNYEDGLIDKQSLLAFNFSFDTIFAQNSIEPGFKNYKYNAPYLLRVDLKWATDDSKNRTLFLYDHRKSDITLEEAKSEAIDSSSAVPSTKDISYSASSTTVKFQDKDTSAYKNFQVRVAQFPSIDKVTDAAYVSQMNDSGLSPYEIRPYDVDTDGALKTYSSDDVAEADKVSLSFNNTYSGSKVYKKNWNWLDNCTIEFNENYDDPTSDEYANGKIYLPAKYVLGDNIDNLKIAFENVTDFDEQAEQLYYLIKDELTINVYAVPIKKDFTCEREYDVICMDLDNSVIEKM